MTAQSTNATPRQSVLAPLAAAGRRFWEFALTHSAGARCAREAERLSALSDAELARIGLRREDIVRHAFRRLASY